MEKILAVHPSTLEDVKKLVVACRDLGLRVRPAGSTHSWGPMFSDEGQVVMYTDKLKPIDGEERMSLWQVRMTKCSFFHKCCIVFTEAVTFMVM